MVKNSHKRLSADDPRFKKVHSDPRFRVLAQKEKKLQVDDRFRSMFTETEFQVPVPLKVDERGVGVTSVLNPLAHLYDTTDIKCIDSEGNFKWEVESSSESEAENSIPQGLDLYEGQLENVKVSEEATTRVAVMNCDWNIIKAVDLLSIFKSIHPGVLKVSIYPSEFGKGKMEAEERSGPQLQSNNNEIDEEDLRKYELDLLKYYYAVAECDSLECALKVYEESDGLEIERTSNVLDLRFVPDGLEFPYPAIDSSTVIPKNYKMLGFYSKALQHSRVGLSWDETPNDRLYAMKNAFAADDIDDEDLAKFIATLSPQRENSDDEEVSAYSYKKKSQFNKMNENLDIEIKFHSAFDEIGKGIQSKESEKSVWEKHLEKKLKKKKIDREERKKAIKEKHKPKVDKKSIENLKLLVDSKGDVEDFQVNSDDVRFGKLYTDSNFGIDPTSNQFKADKDGNKLLLNYQIQKRRIN